MSPKILIVDDDKKNRTLLKSYLERNRYDISLAHDGASFFSEFERQHAHWSLLILDTMLPDTDGFALCKAVRGRSNIPIIMLAPGADETDRIVGLELGADDCVSRACTPRELLARIKALHRRAGLPGANAVRSYHFAGHTLDLVQRELTDPDGQPVALTGLDFQLLKYFAEHPGDILDRAVLCEHTRGRHSGPMDRSLDVQISRLRARLNDDARSVPLIKTVRGAGYVFSADVSASAA
jgi:DNA-binding response OmpR family regulator